MEKWTLMSATLGIAALIAVSLPSFDSAPAVKSERETTLSSLSKPSLPFTVLVSPSLVATSSAPITLTATIQSAVNADRVTVTWALPNGVALASGAVSQILDHVGAGQPTPVSISVTVAAGVTQPILVNALFAHGSVTVGNGARIPVNQAPPVQKRARFDATGDQRIFE